MKRRSFLGMLLSAVAFPFYKTLKTTNALSSLPPIPLPSIITDGPAWNMVDRMIQYQDGSIFETLRYARIFDKGYEEELMLEGKYPIGSAHYAIGSKVLLRRGARGYNE